MLELIREDNYGLAGKNRVQKVEYFTISVLNVIADLSKTPIDNSVMLFAAMSLSFLDTDWSILGKRITWNNTQAGYDLEVGDKVVVYYSYLG